MHPHEPDPVASELDALIGAAQVFNTHTNHDAAPRPSGEVGTLVTGVDALADGWATDPAVLKRLLGLLRSWGEPAAGSPPMTQRRHTAGHPEFGVTCRRANLTDPLDITLPATLPRSDRPPVCLPAASFRRSVGPQTSESGSSHG